jgi:hypothetical protein
MQGISMTFKETMASIFSTAEGTYYKWKKEKRPIINLLDKYFLQEELEEFLKNGQIQKQELVKNINVKELKFLVSNKSSDDKRLLEILKLLSIYDTDTLSSALLKSYLDNNANVTSGTTIRLNSKLSKIEFIRILANFLDDVLSEISNVSYDTVFRSTIRDFNEKIGFDFDEEDESRMRYIISRYRVYNTLYKLD